MKLLKLIFMSNVLFICSLACNIQVFHMHRLAHRHVERLNVLRTWRQAQVGRARCRGHGMGDMAGCKPARHVYQADGCVGSAG